MVRFTNDQILDLLIKDFKGKTINILAPIVRSRKGHYSELFNSLARKGYLKVRVDGNILELRPSLKLDRYKTHDIEVVIDRLAVTEKNRKRLLESLKLAMDNGDGVMMVMQLEDNSIRYFSKSLMCLDTGLAYKNPEPNSFSFNSPKGACDSCVGLGTYSVVDEQKIIPNKNLSINQGAISPIAHRNSVWIMDQIELIAKKYQFSLKTPFLRFQMLELMPLCTVLRIH